MRILLVEDDRVLSEQIANALRQESFIVEIQRDGNDGLFAASLHSYGLIILDVMLPGMDGWAICREIRRNGGSTPILMLTARDSIEDRVKGLDMGADDYLTKPFDMRELRARISAVLRRETTVRTGVIEIGELKIDTRAHTVERAGKEINLTRREFDLLEALARNVGRTLTRDVILESVWNAEEKLENTVNFHVTSLRKKIDAGFDFKMIQTVHGFGYRLTSDAEVPR